MSTAQKKKPNQSNATSNQGKPSGMVCDNPMTSALIVYGIGLGAGVALISLMCGSAMSRPTLARRTGQAAEHYGRPVLDAIAGVLPESMAKHISN